MGLGVVFPGWGVGRGEVVHGVHLRRREGGDRGWGDVDREEQMSEDGGQREIKEEDGRRRSNEEEKIVRQQAERRHFS